MSGLIWPKHNFCILICFLWITNIIFNSSVSAAKSDKVKLKDVQTLTLRNGMFTNGRRSAGVLQLKCVGGTAGCSVFSPTSVQCYNKGSNGLDVQWECKSDMPLIYKFGAISVSCEGYDYPDDPYVLHGSCGLEYEIDYAPEDKSYSYTTDYYSKKSSGGSGFGTLLILAGVGILAYAIYTTCIAPQNTPEAHGARTPNAGNVPRNGFPSSSSPPPPGFRSDFYPDNNGSCSSGTSSQTRTGTGGGGFWTGAATGGLLGYMFGRSGQNTGSHSSQSFNDYDSWGSPSYGSNRARSSGFTSSSGSSTQTHTSTGFGGTTRR